jgi:hypothetical protein
VHRAVLALAAVAALAGCGRGDDDRAVTAVSERFLRAVEDGQGQRACDQLSQGARDALEHDERASCTEAAPDLDVHASPVRRAQVFATGAKVDLADGASLFLELTPAGWRIAAAGCRPEPRDAPYTCEVEA